MFILDKLLHFQVQNQPSANKLPAEPPADEPTQRQLAQQALYQPVPFPWRTARQIVQAIQLSASNEALVADWERLLNRFGRWYFDGLTDVLNLSDAESAVALNGPRSRSHSLWEGMKYTLLNFLCSAVTGRNQSDYYNQAKQCYAQAFAPLIEELQVDPDIFAEQSVRLGLNWLEHPDQSPIQGGWINATWLPLAPSSRSSHNGLVKLRFHVTAVESGNWPSGLWIDPVHWGLVDFQDDTLQSLGHAYRYALAHYQQTATQHASEAKKLACLVGLRDYQGIVQVHGPSGGTAMAVTLRASLSAATVFDRIAVTAALPTPMFASNQLLNDRLQPIAFTVNKSQALLDEVDRFLACCQSGEHIPSEASQVEKVTSFQEVYDEMTDRYQALQDYRALEVSRFEERFKNTLPPRLANASYQLTAAALQELRVPWRVLRQDPKWQQELAEQLAKQEADEASRQREIFPAEWEKEKIKGDLPGLDDSYHPSGSVERLEERYRQQVQEFAEIYRTHFTTVESKEPLVILADPGYGKTLLSIDLLLQQLNSLIEKVTTNIPTGLHGFFPVRVTCLELAPHLSLPLLEALVKILEHRLKDSNHCKTVIQMLRDAWQRNRVLLLVDGWDERDQDKSKELEGPLVTAAQANRPLVLTSRVVGYNRPLAVAAEYRLMCLEPGAGVEALVRGWFGADSEAANQMADQMLTAIRNQPSLQHLLRVPLLGSLACRLWSEGEFEGLQLPANRSQFLEIVLEFLVRNTCRDPQKRVNVKNLRNALARFTAHLFTGQRFVIDVDDLENEINKHATGFGVGFHEALKNRFGLFASAGRNRSRDQLEILHQSFAEYLVARHIVDTYGSNATSLQQWLNQINPLYFHDSRWVEVWCHIGALLPDQQTDVLLQHIYNRAQTKDDVLASACNLLVQVLGACGNNKNLPSESKLLDYLKQVLDFESSQSLDLVPIARAEWIKRLIDSLQLDSSHIRTSAAEALGRIGPVAQDAVKPLIQLLSDRDSEVHRAAAVALAQIGPVDINPLILLLAHNDWTVRLRAAKTLGQIGAAAASAIEPLKERLEDEKCYVRGSAAEALGRIGPKAAKATELLIRLLSDKDEQVCRAAAEALGRMGPAAIEPLTSLFKNDNRWIRGYAAEALGRIGPSAIEPLTSLLLDEDRSEIYNDEPDAFNEIFDSAFEPFAYLLRDSKVWVLSGAAEALGRIGPKAAKATELLIHLLHDDDQRVRGSAAEALGRIGPKAAKATELLIRLLSDKDEQVCRAAAEALGRMGPAAIEPLIRLLPSLNEWIRRAAAFGLGEIGPVAIEPLTRLLIDDNKWVRNGAAAALGRIGPAAIEPLTRLLINDNEKVRGGAAEAIGRMGPAAIEPLTRLLSDKNCDVRHRDVDALGEIGPATIESFTRLLDSANEWVRGAAAWALGEIGPAAIVAVEPLIDLLSDKNNHVRSRAARALGEIGPEAARATQPLIGLLRDGDWLVCRAGAEALGRIGPTAAIAIEPLTHLLRNENDWVRGGAAEALGGIGPAAAVAIEPLARLLRDQKSHVRSSAARALSKLGSAAIEPLIHLLSNSNGNSDVRYRAAEALREIGPAAINPLIRLLSSSNEWILRRAAEALGGIGPNAKESIEPLTRLLEDSSREVRKAAAYALKRIIPSNQVGWVVSGKTQIEALKSVPLIGNN